MSIKSEDVLLNALNHQIRREILHLLESDDRSYTQILELFAISTGKLNYHLKILEGLIEKSETNWYSLTPLGQKTMKLLDNFRNGLSDQDQPLIKRAYLSQQKAEPSFLHLMFVSRMNFKFWLLIIMASALIISSLIYLSLGGEVVTILPMLVAGVVVGFGGFVWLIRIRRTAPEFVSKMDKVLTKFEDSEK